MDAIRMELNERLISHEKLFVSFQGLIPFYCNDHEVDHVQLSEFYHNEINVRQLLSEIQIYQEKWMNVPKNDQQKTALESLNECDLTFFPNIHTALKIFCTLPVTTSSAERSFSTLKLIKTYLRNTMSENRLNGLAMLSIHRDISITVEEVINLFATDKKRRLNFLI